MIGVAGSDAASELPPEQARSLHNPFRKANESSLTRGPIRRREALLVGINGYIDSSVAPLRYCVNDIRAMQHLLERLGYIVHALHDEAATMDRKPTRANVAGLLDAVCARLGPDAMLLVQISCHGMLVDDSCFLLMMDTWRNRIAQDGLPIAQVRDAIRASKARQRVLLLDACHSGVDLDKGLPAPTESPAAAAEVAFNRRVLELTQGFAVLSSSSASQVSQEWRDKKHGLFTYFVLEGLQGKATSDSSVVTVDDLRHHVRREMVRWNEQNPNRVVQEPTAHSEGSGDIILSELARLVDQRPAQTPVSYISRPAIDSHASAPTSALAAPALTDPVAEIAVACGCDRDEQWSSWQSLAPSQGNWLFVLLGPKGEAHDLFLRRLEEDRRRAFPGHPPPLFRRVSWPTRHGPPAGLASYRQSLALALHANDDSDDSLLEQLKQQRQGYQLVLLHPLISRGHCDVDLLTYYGEWLPSLLERSQGPRTLGVKLVQPMDWVPTRLLLRLAASAVAALWPRVPESCTRALSGRQAQRFIKHFANKNAYAMNLEILPKLGRISELQVRQFLRSMDIPASEQEQLLQELRPLDRESGYLLYNLIKQLPAYTDPRARMRGILKSFPEMLPR